MSYTRIFVAVALLVASTCAEDPWTPSPLCPFPSEELTRFPYEGDCSKYWECYEGARYPMDCPSRLEFNDAVKRCDNPEVANCDPDATIIYPTYPHSTQSTASTEPTKDPGPAPECPFPSDELIFYPVVNNCSQYWECFQGNRYLMNCPRELYWNVLANYCDFLENVDCSRNNQTTSTTPSTPTTPGNSTTDSTESTETPDITPTPTPSTTTEAGPTTEWTPDPLCPYPSEELDFYPNAANCSQYFECFAGNKFTMSCPAGLYWNNVACICDYKQNVDLSQCTESEKGESTTVTTASPTTPNAICQHEPDGTYLPNPEDCSRFYECVSGRPTEGQCPGDLVWNEPIHSCDYPTNVNCENPTQPLQ